MTDMTARFPQAQLDPSRTTGLIVCGMGGPDGPDAVQPFLCNLFRDPLIFPLPRLIAGPVGRLIAWRRAPEVRKRYAMISKTSITPQLGTTRRQAEVLAGRLGEAGHTALPGVAMRYWKPFPDQTVAELAAQGARQFIVLPMYPQYSGATNGSTIDFVLAALGEQMPEAPVHVVPDWHLLPGFIEALSEAAIETLIGWAEAGAEAATTGMFYVAHSLPESFIRKGDPYLIRTRETVSAVHRCVKSALSEAGHGPWLNGLLAGGAEAALTFQSKVGPIAWLGPQIEDETPLLGGRGCRRLFVQPVSFTCEHIETLLELDVELADTARASGIAEFRRGRALNLNPSWLASLADHLRDTAFVPGVDSHAC